MQIFSCTIVLILSKLGYRLLKHVASFHRAAVISMSMTCASAKWNDSDYGCMFSIARCFIARVKQKTSAA